MARYADAILVEATDAELRPLVEENLFSLFRTMAAILPGEQLIENDHLSFHLIFPHNPMFKGVWRIHLTEDNAETLIDETLAWFRSQDAPFLFWWTGSATTPTDIGNRLIKRGLKSYEAQVEDFAPGIISTDAGAPGMIAELQRLNNSALEQVPSGFSIEVISTRDQLEAFKQVFMASYEIPEWAAQAWIDATLAVGVGRTPWRMYLGRLNGLPVAINMLFCGAGVASVYAVGTIPSARGKGIGGAITLKPLLDARDMGYRYGVLFASEMGIHTYERIGFRLAGTRINRYLWHAQ